jgi:phospholipase/carboxylesterase
MDDARASWELLPRFAGEACDAYGGDPARVVLVGFSQGGMTALAALLAAPEAFLGAAVLGGRLLPAALAAAAPAERLAGRRVLCVHGTEDRHVGVDLARDLHTRLAALPVALEYHEVAARHAITAEVRALVTAWARARRASSTDRPTPRRPRAHTASAPPRRRLPGA